MPAEPEVVLQFTTVSLALGADLLSFVSEWLKDHGYTDAKIKDGKDTITGREFYSVTAIPPEAT